MAIAAVHTSVMDLGADKTVHPFFVKSQNTTLACPEKSNPTVRTELQHSDGGLVDKPMDEDDVTGRSSRAKPGKRSRKRKDKEGPVSRIPGQVLLEDFVQNPVKQANGLDGSHDRGTFGAVSLEQDPNRSKRKRRKTASLRADTTIMTSEDTSRFVPQADSVHPSGPPSTSWYEQLRAEVVSDADMAMEETSGPTDAITNVVASSITVPTTPPRPLSTISENTLANDTSTPLPQPCHSKVASLSLPAVPVPTVLAVLSEIVPEQSSKKPGPERKMLRLKPNGRFSSPPSTLSIEALTDEISSTPPKKRRRRKALKQLVVILRYGGDEDIRASRGGEIEHILAGVKRVVEEKSKHQKTSTKASGPPKPTHPFFSGKPVNKAENKRDPPVIHSRARHSAVTPGKLRAQAQALHPNPDSQDAETNGPSWTIHRMPKLLGSREAAWPSRDTLHVRGSPSDRAFTVEQHTEAAFSGIDRQRDVPRKLKGNIIQIPDDENIIHTCAKRLDMDMLHGLEADNNHANLVDTLRTPERSLTTGRKLQETVRRETRSRLMFPTIDSADDTRSENELHLAGDDSISHHPALAALYEAIEGYLSPFDEGRCESQSWVQKYAPRRAAEVLQSTKEVAIIRNWLNNLTVTSVVSGTKESIDDNRAPSKSTTTAKSAVSKPPKKKRKKAPELDDFIVSDGEDVARMDELTDPEEITLAGSQHSQKRSLVRLGDHTSDGGEQRQKLTNAVLLSGPHGCGKTAAVYAVAKELEFEVFEINAGGRRSGRDILDRVGDMVENHIVQRSRHQTLESTADDSVSLESEAMKKELESGRQGTMNSFFKVMDQQKPMPKHDQSSETEVKEEMKRLPGKAATHRQQKQSLILLEEVDILFEEDKNFWMTVLSLAAQSKRPIIMTCNDEDVVPLNALSLHGILRFSPAPVDLATDYLLLLAAREGHILSRNAVSTLYESKAYDLRASIMDLDFWCQMSVGDRRGGLDWMYQRWPPGTDVDEHGQKLRVASKGTYLAGLGWIGHDMFSATAYTGFDREHELLLEAWDNWHLEPTEWSNSHAFEQLAELSVSGVTTPADNLEALRTLDRWSEHLSAADTYCGVGLPTGSKATVDATQPPLTEQARSNFVEGYSLLQADPVVDYANLDTHLAIDAYLYDTRSTTGTVANTANLLSIPSSTPLDEQIVIPRILTHLISRHTSHLFTRADFSAAFDPISEPPTSALSHTQTSNHLTPSSFDRPFAILTTDLAPYVRSIAAYDERLEARRLRSSGLLSAGGGAGSGKRVRTTRASRSALEGGKRETTRRERWFGKRLSLGLVLTTGGRAWAGMGCRARDEEAEMDNVPSQEGVEVGSARSQEDA